MKVFILFYLWIVPLVIGLIFFRVTQRTSFKKRFYPGYIMIVLALRLYLPSAT
nr:hypothetical protein [Bacillus licheniformis]